MQVRSTGYTLIHLLALHLPETFPLATIAPWRKHKPVITAGLFAASDAFCATTTHHLHRTASQSSSRRNAARDLRPAIRMNDRQRHACVNSAITRDRCARMASRAPAASLAMIAAKIRW